MQRLILPPAICFAIVFTAQSPVHAELKVGTASQVITPTVGTPMAGYYHARAAEGTHDDLFARVLVLDDGETQAALVALDLIKTTFWMTKETRRIVAEQTGIPGDHVMLSGSHAHTGPVLSEPDKTYEARIGGASDLSQRYMEELPAKIAAAVKKAYDARQPATLSVASSQLPGVAFNRRFFMTDGSVGWNPGKLNPKIVREAGPVDEEVPIVVARDEDGHPLATYVNLSMHLDTVGGTEWSADAPATLYDIMQRVHGSEMVTLFTAGCCGDVNHINVRSGTPQKGHREATRIGTHLAASVLRSFEKLAPLEETTLRVQRQVVSLATPKITQEDVTRSAETIARFDAAGGQSRPKFMETVDAFKVRDIQNRDSQPWDVDVQVVTIGNRLAIVALPGEVFAELGLTIKQGSPFETTIITELANGSVGYIPNRVAYPQGNYEVVSARIAEGSGEKLVDTALTMLREMWPGE